uniref:VWFC domain-containing protein n=1 Tax=Lates calcarifer TaxID=8187 RepID=A0A4W6DVL0_LATCA
THYCFLLLDAARVQRLQDLMDPCEIPAHGLEVYRMDPCWLCQCRGGISFCSKAECAELDCENFYIPEGECCPVCIGTSPGGEFYVEGETWNLDECTRCTCRKGRVLCDTEVCPPALCQTPIRNKDTCCHVSCMLRSCRAVLYSWKANACTSCTCNNGTIQCFSQRCPAANCRVPVLRKGQCCPHCLGKCFEASQSRECTCLLSHHKPSLLTNTQLMSSLLLSLLPPLTHCVVVTPS